MVGQDGTGEEQGSEERGPEQAWAAKPGLSRLLRIAISVFPLACALASTTVARRLLPVPDSTGALVAQWVVLLVLGVGVAIGTERIARRFLPLAALLKLSMLFPSRAPSRFKVARQAGSLRQLETSEDDDPDDAAATILALVARLSEHDRRTRGHSERVRVYTDMLAEELKLDEADRYRLRWAALLHDIGKLTVPAEILNKTDPLSDDEWAALQEHPIHGMELAAPLVEWLGPWADTIAHHHERFDGTGYPAGFAAEEIGYGARIVSVADSYDTMTSVRSYKKPLATRAAREELVACAGGQFDPVVVRAFLAISLPRLLWASGPASLLVHLPFLARLQAVGQVSVASAAQSLTATAAAGVVAIGLIAPTAAPAVRADAAPTVERSTDADDRGDGKNTRGNDDGTDGGKNDGGRDQDARDDDDGNGGNGGNDGNDGDDGNDDVAPPGPDPSPGNDPGPAPDPDPNPEPEPQPEPDPEPESRRDGDRRSRRGRHARGHRGGGARGGRIRRPDGPELDG